MPQLEDALLGCRPWRYAMYRLRYLFVRALLRTGLRIFELGLFASVVPLEFLGPILVVRSGLFVGESLWWGALEPLRTNVRELMRDGRTGQASLQVRQWLALSVTVGLGTIGLAGLWVAAGPSEFQSFSAIDAYVLGSALRFGLDVWLSAYQAGVFGVRRIHRPAWSILATDAADFAFLGLAFWGLGPWGLGVAQALSGALRAAISWTFTRRVYAQLKLEVSGAKTWLAAWRKANWSPRVSATFALGNAIGEVDALIVLGLVAAPGSPEGSLLLAALFHVLSPLQSTAATWSRLFYFDFKRLEAWGSPLLLQRFEAFLGRTAWLVPLPLGATMLALLAAFWQGPYLLLGLGLTCFAAARVWLSLMHIRAYSLADHHFLARLFWSMVCVAAMSPWVARLAPELALGLITVATAVGLLVVGRSQQPLSSATRRVLLGASAWIYHVVRERGQVRLGLIRIDHRLSSVGRLAHAVRQAGLTDASLCRLSHDTLLWFERVGERANSGELDRSTLAWLTTGGGVIKELKIGPAAPNGPAALAAGLPGETWRRQVDAVLSSARSPARDPMIALREALQQVHPSLQSRAFSPHASFLASLTGEGPASRVERRALLRVVLDAARGRPGLHTLGSVDVAAIAPSGQPVTLFVAPTGARPSAPWRSDVSRLLRQADLEMALRSATTAAHHSPPPSGPPPPEARQHPEQPISQ